MAYKNSSKILVRTAELIFTSLVSEDFLTVSFSCVFLTYIEIVNCRYKFQFFKLFDLSILSLFLSLFFLSQVSLILRVQSRDKGRSRMYKHISNGVLFLARFLFVCGLLLGWGEAANITSGNDSPYPVIPQSCSSAPSQITYDVFVSFRGPDIRRGFLSHLVEAFSRNQIVAFVDNKLHKGDEISESLLGAIERSSISVIIFSQNYASSHWCLDELVKIVESRRKEGQIVLPVFFKVDPTDVRHQKGAYGDAFAELEKKHNSIRVLAWRSALKEAADISGYHSSNFW